MIEITAREKIYQVIFGTDTTAGQRFDILLIYMILLSVLGVIFDSVGSIHDQYGTWIFRLEWVFTALFSIEYLLRIYSSPKRLSYIFSFYGLVDLLSIVPTYLALFTGWSCACCGYCASSGCSSWCATFPRPIFYCVPCMPLGARCWYFSPW